MFPVLWDGYNSMDGAGIVQCEHAIQVEIPVSKTRLNNGG